MQCIGTHLKTARADHFKIQPNTFLSYRTEITCFDSSTRRLKISLLRIVKPSDSTFHSRKNKPAVNE